MKSLFVASLLLSTMLLVHAEDRLTLPLWPTDVPGEHGDIGEERDMTKPNEGLVAGQRVIRLGNVSKPTLTFYPAPHSMNHAAVLVCPGGAYHILAMDLEGTEVCERLNAMGVNAVLLKYRVPERKGLARHAAALQDSQRAMGLVRQHATEWKIDPKRIGILGFSAGGHLAATTSGDYEKRSYEKLDAADDLSSRPDFTILIYPAYLTDKDNALAPEVHVTSNNPPAFIAQTQDDGVRVENALYYYAELQKAKVPAELHIYPSGGHGYGLRTPGKNVTAWPKRLEEWLHEQGIE